MLTAQRKLLIQNELTERGRVQSGDLAQRYGLSEDTIRRDLRQLAADGYCRRVYGGAVAPYAGDLAQRHDHLAPQKSLLAQRAAQLIKPGQAILIDAGSTNSAIAQVLGADQNLTVITNAPDIAGLLTKRRDISLIILGGDYDSETGACTGPATQAALAALRADVLFLGSCGVDADQGITAFDTGEAAVKQAMVDASDRVIVAATDEKIGTSAPHRVVAMNKVNDLILPTGLDGGLAFQKQGVTLHRV